MRVVALDVETTGLSVKDGDKVVEVACAELEGLTLTGREFHRRVDPQRDVPEEATRVHGMRREDLAGEPLFRDIAGDLLEFMGGASLAIHNAEFDMGFLREEFLLAGVKWEEPETHDTLLLARERFPGVRNDLASLARRLGVTHTWDATGVRTPFRAGGLHGALEDVRILAQVYRLLHVGEGATLWESKEGAPEERAEREEITGEVELVEVLSAARGDVELHEAFIRRSVTGSFWLRELKGEREGEEKGEGEWKEEG